MAEGGLSESTMMVEGQEEYFDFNCGQCETEGKFVEAIAYCPECPMHACDRCLEFHTRFLPTKDHVTLDRSRKDEWGKVKRAPKLPKSGVECKEHDDQMVTMFCSHHDTYGCSVCVSIYHKTCEDMAFIPHIAKEIVTPVALRQAIADADQTLIKVSRAKAVQKSDQDSFKKSRSLTLKKIADYRKEVNSVFDKLEDQLKLQMKNTDEPVIKKIEHNITNCENMEKTAKQFKTALQQAQNKSDTEIFIDLKDCQKRLPLFNIITEKKSIPLTPKLEFVQNKALLQDIKKFANIGEVEAVTTRTNKAYTISKQETRNLKLPDDANTCFIDGMCRLPGGLIILADKANKRLKSLDGGYNVMSYYDLPNRPYAICGIGSLEAAVSLANKTIHFIDIDWDITTTKILQLDHQCHGLTYHSASKSLITSDYSGKRVDVYNLSGQRIRTIQHDSSGNYIFEEARHVAVNTGGSRIYVTDKDKGLIIVDGEGRLLSTLSSPALQGSRGICMDTHGNVFIACCLSHKVVQVNNKGDTIIGNLVEKKHGLHFPGMALFDEQDSRLLVANIPRALCNTLQVYKLDMQ